MISVDHFSLLIICSQLRELLATKHGDVVGGEVYMELYSR